MATEVLADDRALREGRRRRALTLMEDNEIDVLVLGREANARYVSGAQRLWTAGTRPFGPSCVFVRETQAVHLVSTWDEGIPDDIPHENLFGITWNPGNLLAWLRGIDGVRSARRVGTDSLTPRFAAMLPKVFGSAELVDAEPMLEAARSVKTSEEIEAIRVSISVAEGALSEAVAELRPGVTERHLAAVFMDAMARRGITTPASQKVAWRTADLVAFDGGVVAGGYNGEVGRTWPADGSAIDGRVRDLYERADDLWDRLLDTCAPGRPCRDLLAAYEKGGEALPAFPVAFGMGLGFDVPVVTRQLERTASVQLLEAGMVVAVTAYVEDEDRAVFRKEAVLLSDDGSEVLTSAPHWQP